MAQLPSSLADILPKIQDELVLRLGIPSERVIFDDPSMIIFPQQSDQVIVIWPDVESCNLKDTLGTGRLQTREIVSLEIAVFTKKMTDSPNSKQSWLMDHLKLRHAVLDAMVCFQPSDPAGNWLISRPILPRRDSSPEKMMKRDPGWGQSRMIFEIEYTLRLDQSRQ